MKIIGTLICHAKEQKPTVQPSNRVPETQVCEIEWKFDSTIYEFWCWSIDSSIVVRFNQRIETLTREIEEKDDDIYLNDNILIRLLNDCPIDINWDIYRQTSNLIKFMNGRFVILTFILLRIIYIEINIFGEFLYWKNFMYLELFILFICIDNNRVWRNSIFNI